MKVLLALAALALPFWLTPRQDPGELRAQADSAFAEGSYELARAKYAELSERELAPELAAWVAFRVVDATWRSQVATNQADASVLEQALAELRALADPEREDWRRDQLWLEAREAWGDAHWRQGNSNWGEAWPAYRDALDGWAASSDIDLARERYLQIVWKATRNPWDRGAWSPGYNLSSVEPRVLDGAVKIARGSADRSRALYLRAMADRSRGRDPRVASRVVDALQAVLAFGRESEWYDDALMALGQHYENVGAVRRVENQWLWESDFVAAVATYRRLVDEFRRGETPYHDDALRRLENLTKASLGITVTSYFLPGSTVRYGLSWRNAKEVALSLVPVDLTRDPSFEEGRTSDWLERLDLRGKSPVRSWQHATEDDGRHVPGSAELVVDGDLPLGAYVLVARADTATARALVLVSDVALTLKVVGNQRLAWLVDARSGAPIPDARVHTWEFDYIERDWRSRERDGSTGADGTLLFPETRQAQTSRAFVAARLGARQAFALAGSSGARSAPSRWVIDAHTDRSVYRPGDTVRWKLVARMREDDGYRVPEGEHVAWAIRDPQGAVLAEGEATLNAFGAAWAELPTKAGTTLGEYKVAFEWVRKAQRDGIGGATLFRLEEYKAPEFEVTVDAARDAAGNPQLYRVGDEVAFDVLATYYYGAPVSGAEVEVFVYQKPFQWTVRRPREFPWLYEQENQWRDWYGGPGQQVHQERLKTDAAGRATVRFETAFDLGSDYEYTIEARVVDASRREVVGNQVVRVTREAFHAQLEIERRVHLPGTPVDVELETEDANGNPLAAEGAWRVLRRQWIEIWRGPRGREVSGAELDRLRARSGGFPGEDVRDRWAKRFEGYEEVEVARGTVGTGADGTASWSFTPPSEGTYSVRWEGADDRGAPVTAEASFFVADKDTRDLGYLPGGVELLLDKETFAVGEEAIVLLTTPASGRWVLFTVESEGLLHHEVLHLEGRAKLLRLPLTEAHVPNVWFGAASVWDGAPYGDRVEVVVPPTRKFLDVALSFDAEAYRPGTAGALDVLVTGHDGEPVETELSLAVVDDALSYIQADYGRDPRRVFYGTRNQLRVRTSSSFDYRRFADPNEEPVDEYGRPREKKEGGRGGYRGPGDTVPPSSELDALGYAAAEEAAPVSRMVDSANPGFGASADRAQAGQASGPAVRVRSDFRKTAAWVPDVVTGADGRARVPVSFPDSTTRWRATARAADAGARFGFGQGSTRTRQPLIARLQAPRFFQVGDVVTVSGNLNNNTEGALDLEVSLAVEGLELAGDGAARKVRVPAGDQIRVDWPVRVTAAGEAKLLLSALGGEVGDAVELRLPVHPHGIEAFVARSGKARDDGVSFDVELPAERVRATTSFRVQVTPSLAVTMLDALPYLVDYPYGCTEQTLSRFLPAAIVARTLRDRGLSAEDAMQRAFGGIELEWASATHPDGPKALDRLDDAVARGLERLYDFQHSDGGWGWWKDGDSDRYMTAYVLWGLSLARDAGLDVRAGVLERAARWLAEELVEEERDASMQAWMLHALAAFGRDTGDPRSAGFIEAAWARVLGEGRDELNAYGRALLALAAHASGNTDVAQRLVRNLANGVVRDDAPDVSIVQRGGPTAGAPFVQSTAHWGKDRLWRRWSDGGIEATAFALRALLAIDPTNELVEPAMTWLVKNRRAAQWSNTRDTSIAVLALNDYLTASGELGNDVAFEVRVNGKPVGAARFGKDELLRAPSAFTVDPAELVDGANTVELVNQGEGALYFAAYASFFSLEEPIPARGSEVFVRRDYYRLAPRATLLAGEVLDRVPLVDGGEIRSGERIEVVLTVEAKNDLEYLLLEDNKPAGFEAVQVRSGEPLYAYQLKRSEVDARIGAEGTEEERDLRRRGSSRDASGPARPQRGTTGRQRWLHQELRDRKVAMFASRLDEGLWEIRYELRAETPGSFHALPLEAHAMYVPEIRANGEEVRVTVIED